MNQYNYFNISRVRYPGQIVSPVDENAIPWEEDFWNTRAVVLEANEESLGGRHIPAFLMAALAELQQKRPPETGYGRSSATAFLGIWRGENGGALAKKGFAIPERQLTWITGRRCRDRITVTGEKCGAPIDYGSHALRCRWRSREDRQGRGQWDSCRIVRGGGPVGPILFTPHQSRRQFGALLSNYIFRSRRLPGSALESEVLRSDCFGWLWSR